MAALMIRLLIGGLRDATGPRFGVEQDPDGLLEPTGAVTARDECGVDDPPRGTGLAVSPTHRVGLLLRPTWPARCHRATTGGEGEGHRGGSWTCTESPGSCAVCRLRSD